MQMIPVHRRANEFWMIEITLISSLLKTQVLYPLTDLSQHPLMSIHVPIL